MKRELSIPEARTLLGGGPRGNGCTVKVEWVDDDSGWWLKLHLPPSNAPAVLDGLTVYVDASLDGLLCFQAEVPAP